MSININAAPLPINADVVFRQVDLQLLASTKIIKKGALEALTDRSVIHLTPHPEVTLGNPVDWFMDPLGERNWCAQLHMLRWLRPLVAQSKDEQDGKAANLLARYIRSWADSALPIEQSPKYAWADMIEAVRALEFLDAYTAVPTADQQFVADLLYLHGEWLIDPENLGHSNHAVWQHMALFVIGHAFGEQGWIASAKERIAYSFANEYDDEGINREAAPGYHLYNYVLWQDVNHRMMAEGDGIPDLDSKLDLARKALIQFTWPDGNLIELGDTAPRTHLKKLAENADVQYVLSKGAEGEIPTDLFSTFEAGYTFGRSGWGANAKDYQDEFFWGLRHGKVGVHGHNDLGSLYLGASGERFLIDAGKYAYLNDENKRHVAGRSAHNTLVVRGADVKADAYYEVLSKHHSTSVDDITTQGFPYFGIRHTRRVVYVRGADAVIVLDEATSKSEHDYNLYWHLHPQSVVEGEGGLRRVKVGDAILNISELGTIGNSSIVRGVSQPEMEGWYSPEWGKMEATPTLKMTKSGGRIHFITVFASDDKEKFEIEVSGQRDTQFILTTPSGYFHVDVSSNPATVSFSRGGKPTKAVYRKIDDITLSRMETEIDANAEAFQSVLGSRIRQRVEHFTQTHQTVGKSIRRGIELCQDVGAKDHGIRAAVIDAVACGLGENHPIVSYLQNGLGGFRSPLYLDTICNPQDSRGLFETDLSPKRTFQGLAIEGGDALPWAGRQGNATLLVRLNGAIDRSKVSLPFFGGLSSMLNRDESMLVFSDPSFDRNEELTLGWYLGELPDGSLVFDWINRVIDEYVQKWNIEQVVLFGASGGGFASLQIGLRRDHARVLAMNPQTILPNYFRQFYERGRDSAFTEGAVAAAKYPEAFDVRLLLKQSGFHGSVHYVENAVGDKHHHAKHFLPFDEAANQNEFTYKHIVVDLGNGHRPVGTALVNQYLDEIVSLKE